DADGTQMYGGRSWRGPNSCATTAPKLGYAIAGLGRYPVNMLCVPRSCAASPCVIDRMMVYLSAIWPSFGSRPPMTSPVLVFTVPNSPRYSSGALGLGSKVSMWLMPPAMKMKITDCAFG